MMLVVLSYIFIVGSCISSWQNLPDDNAQTLPSIEVSLDPPASPWPQVNAEIGNMEVAREQFEEAGARKLAAEFVALRIMAKQRIGQIVGRAMRVLDDPHVISHGEKKLARRRTFLGGGAGIDMVPKSNSKQFFAEKEQSSKQDGATSVRLQVEFPAPLDPRVRSEIHEIEQARSALEREDIDKAVLSMNGIAESILNDFEAVIRVEVEEIINRTTSVDLSTSRTFAMLQLGKMLPDVVVVPTNANYPNSLSLAEQMESRRNSAESLLAEKILQLHIRLIYDINDMIADAITLVLKRMGATPAGPA